MDDEGEPQKELINFRKNLSTSNSGMHLNFNESLYMVLLDNHPWSIYSVTISSFLECGTRPTTLWPFIEMVELSPPTIWRLTSRTTETFGLIPTQSPIFFPSRKFVTNSMLLMTAITVKVLLLTRFPYVNKRRRARTSFKGNGKSQITWPTSEIGNYGYGSTVRVRDCVYHLHII